MGRFFSVAALASLLSIVSAQTSSSCNPTLKSGCPADPAMGTTLVTDFTKANAIPDGWSLVPNTVGTINYNSKGANIVLAKQGDNPTLQSNGYFLYGSFEVKIIAAPGQGVVTSMILLSDDLDEVDWELLGTNTAQVQSNYFGKGDATTYNRAAWHAVANPQTTSHTYKVDWSNSTIVWSIDGTPVRTLNYADAASGTRFPQTPMRVRIGIWAGGDPSNGEGTIEWAGGLTDYTKAPYTMYLQSVSVTNLSPGKSYTYSDTSGSSGSIKVDGGSVGAVSASSVVKASSMTTSLSIASAAPSNPLTSMASGNATKATTSPTDKPLAGSGSGSSNASSTVSTGSPQATSNDSGRREVVFLGALIASFVSAIILV
ncbi:concanavalin A-like lectin/glucanase [Microthyrium microscopicum]|uniref:Crh-like protein n=1 Tax=Microthyrium microscopicum TaxID=703497 RepID=A0A6A6UDV0_9PEZI|nr:concanavalin A-like lectin/glucanase [Microthyrium microscopicum]